MKFSEQWLRSWVDPALTTQQMCDQLTMAGLEVDGVEPAAADFSGVVVAQVEALQKHPDADKLNICQVNDGKQVLQIVCGAPNVRQGLKIPLATLGACLPGEKTGDDSNSKPFKIKPAKLRGVESSGMLCSEKELGLAEQADGLMELAADAPLGEDLRDYLSLDDTIIDIDLTPNRGDCLSIAGIARELAVLNECSVNRPPMEAVIPRLDDSFSVELEAETACSHYAGRIIKGVDTQARSPVWLTERLRRSGIRSNGPVVDITNYVMLELGQPMHAFDLDRLHGSLHIRYAQSAEKMTLLDGKPVTLDADTLVVADDDRPLAIAGIMGGEDSGVSQTTNDIFLESAYFRPEVIAGKARSYGLHTDSSHRFERGVDTGLQVVALERASELIMQICGGEAAKVQEYITRAHPLHNPQIHVRRQRIKRVLGIAMEDSAIEAIFTRLGFDVQTTDEGWQVQAPGYRFDINIEADLLEELVRVYGYNNIPRIHASYPGIIQPRKETHISLVSLKNRLVNRGYFEVVTYSFVDPAMQAIFDPPLTPVALANPISSEMSVMRTTLWIGLLQAMKYNLNRQQTRVRLFEAGLCFYPDHTEGATSLQAGITQQPMFAGVIAGDHLPQQWGSETRKVDYFDLKADVEALLEKSRYITEFKAAEHPVLHPGQSACLMQNGQLVGWLGALHPSIQKQLGIDPQVYLFEIQQSAINESTLPAFKSLSRYPEVRRDIAILVDVDISAADLLQTIHQNASRLLVDCELFDIYQGKGVEKGIKSVAFGLILQDLSCTLTDQDVETEIENIVSALNQQFAATLRE